VQRRIAASSLGPRTVRKSRSTGLLPPLHIGGSLRRSRPPVRRRLSDLRYSRRKVEEQKGAEPPPTSDSPEMMSAFNCAALLSCAFRASARARISRRQAHHAGKNGMASWFWRLYSIKRAFQRRVGQPCPRAGAEGGLERTRLMQSFASAERPPAGRPGILSPL